METPKKCAECVHLNDYKKFERKTEARLEKLEESREQQEETMKELTDGVHTINRAIMGDIQDPTKPGMAENMRTVQSDVGKLVKIHEDEAKAKMEADAKAASDKPSFLESLSWKTITAMVGIIGGLVAIIIKLIDLIHP